MMDDASTTDLSFIPGDGVDGDRPDGDGARTEASNDLTLLNWYCAKAKAPKDNSDEARLEADASWQPVRDWLSSHSAEEVRVAAEQRGESGQTALHFACRNVPPMDVLRVFLSVGTDIVQWADVYGWLPIHYACASGSDPAVIEALAEAYPASLTATDLRGRTPLHFALGEKPASPEIIALLSSTGGAECPDEMGMLPLFYACMYGASEEVLLVLTKAYPQAISTRDKARRTPLHFTLSNAVRKTAPNTVRLLLSLDPSIVNSVAGEPLPLRVLAEYAGRVKERGELQDEIHENLFRCLEYLIKAAPEPTADFFTALQSLPSWLSERAVVMPEVQHLLNEKIAQRFPTLVLMLDFYMLAVIIGFYSRNVVHSLHNRSPEDLYKVTLSRDQKHIEFVWIFPLYLGMTYFFLREIMHVMSLLSLRVFKLWLYDLRNYLNVVFVIMVSTWAIIMHLGAVNNSAFRIGASVSVTLLWVKMLAYLRNMLIDFSVFVGGVFYVLQRLAAFLVALGVIIIAFAQMWVTLNRDFGDCRIELRQNLSDGPLLRAARCVEEEVAKKPFCDMWNSWLHVYAMLLGNVSEEDFKGQQIISYIFFIVFMFLAVILLSNVLIGIVTETYKIQEKRGAVVFWTNRLDFVAEMDAITNGPWKTKLKKFLGMRTEPTSSRSIGVFGQEFWVQVMDLFEDEYDEQGDSFTSIVYPLLRITAGVIIIFFWIPLGLVTAGWLWPPQVRELLFASSAFKHVTDAQAEENQRRLQVQILNEEVIGLKDDLLQQLALDRSQIARMKSKVAERRLEIADEMVNVKRLVAVLFERNEG